MLPNLHRMHAPSLLSMNPPSLSPGEYRLTTAVGTSPAVIVESLPKSHQPPAFSNTHTHANTLTRTHEKAKACANQTRVRTSYFVSQGHAYTFHTNSRGLLHTNFGRCEMPSSLSKNLAQIPDHSGGTHMNPGRRCARRRGRVHP